jgi:hypothetical protein
MILQQAKKEPKIIKTYLMTPVIQEKLVGVGVLTNDKELAYTIAYNDIIAILQQKN